MSKQDVSIEWPATLGGEAIFQQRCTMGAFSYVSGRSRFMATDIGRFCSIADSVLCGLGDHPVDRLSTHPFSYNGSSIGTFGGCETYKSMISTVPFRNGKGRTKIGNDVWIGAGVIIMRGVTVGDGAILAGGCVVTKDVEPYSIMVGIPAKCVRKRLDAKTVGRLLSLKWWNYHLDKAIIPDLDFSKINESLDRLEAAISRGKLRLLSDVLSEEKAQRDAARLAAQ